MIYLKKLFYAEEGFSLTELLVVIVIIGILAALAIPKFMNVTTKAKTTEAKLMLRQIYNLQLSYFLENDVYTKDLNAIGFQQETLKNDGGTARYKINVSDASASQFTCTATAVVDFNKDGIFNVWSIDQEGRLIEVVPD